jgi:hypothetical protein
MPRATLGGHPYDVAEENGKLILRFFPKSPNEPYPNDEVLKLTLTDEDIEKLRSILDFSIESWVQEMRN